MPPEFSVMFVLASLAVAALLLSSLSVPPLMVVGPVKVFAAERTKVLVPVFVRLTFFEPALNSLMTPLKVATPVPFPVRVRVVPAVLVKVF